MNPAKTGQAREAFKTRPSPFLHIRVQDDGIGLPDEQLKSQNGVGLFNLRNRLKILGGRLLISTVEGTTFDMDFDLKPHLKKNA